MKTLEIVNHKGESCNINKKILCEEGYCISCQIAIDYITGVETKNKDILKLKEKLLELCQVQVQH
jgi:hypothetical protein